jgi:hypothetical protein
MLSKIHFFVIRNSSPLCYGFSMKPTWIGYGEFGPIFEGVKGQEAVDFLLAKGKGEIKNAFYHKDIGYIDLIWGVTGEKGYGLAKILWKHPEVIPHLHENIEKGEVTDIIPDRIMLVNKENNHKSIIDLQFNYRVKTWVVTSYILL